MSLSYARSLFITAPLILIYTAILGSISVVSSLIDANGRMQHACARFWGRLILWTSGVRVQTSGLENVQAGAPYVFCANHQSYMDTPIMLAALPFQFRFTPRKDLFRLPFLGWHLRRSGHIPIDRENPHAAMRSLQDAAEKIRRGASVVIFPEGTTSRDGTIMPFKRGGFMLAAQSGVPIVPVTIRGARAVLKPGSYDVRRGKVEVVLGAPISSKETPTADLANRVREEILTNFNYGKTVDRNSYSVSRKI